MKKFLTLFLLTFFAAVLFAQSDDDLFGGSDDDLFGDDGIEEVVDVKAKSDLSKGVLFENGSIKIGGNFTTGLSTMTTLYSEEEKSFGDNLKDTKLTPDLSAFLTVDARPSQELRMYSKFGIKYPFDVKAATSMAGQKNGMPLFSTTVSDWFTLKELFTDFSLNDTAFFRFGLHTVTWGTGYFFSPVSNLINATAIDPENVSAQVDGVVNLRTQVVFPNTQNCLWFYVVPSTNFTNAITAESYARDTALAGKVDILLGTWELGVGGLWKYETAPKAMLTATGSFKSWSVFGEFVYRYGADAEWLKNKEWDDKTSLFQASAGLSRYWKDPAITFAAQYYFNGNNKDIDLKSPLYGHTVAAITNFGKLFDNTDLSLNLYCMANMGRENMPEMVRKVMDEGKSTWINTITGSAMVNYTPVKNLSLGAGPYITWISTTSKPVVSLKLTAKLGGGQF